MHAGRSNGDHQSRLQSREEQTRGWVPAPPPPRTFSIHDGTRQRLEWETRDTINNRLWADTMDAGAKQVTAAMLASHVSHGALTQQPSASRTDERPYHTQFDYFPDAARPTERAPLPPKNLFQNPWTDGYDIEGGDVARGLMGAVKESNRFLTEDVSMRVAGRTFEHQWIPAAVTQAIAERKIEASTLLRPAHDDYRQNYLSPSSN
jgi:hypothetical protein